jgi:anti-sigma-K factor RskA
MKLLQPDRLDALAREHALGTLHGGARRRFEGLLARHPEARAALERWHEHFAPLAAVVPPLQPREAVWQQLSQRLRLQQPAAATGWRRWLALPALGGALAGVLAGVGIGTVVLQQQPQWFGLEVVRDKLPPSYVGVLSNADGKPVVLLSSRRQGRVLMARMLQPLPAPPGLVGRVWAYPEGGGPPFLVGSAPASGIAPMALPDTSERLFAKVERLGLSFEPAGATPVAPSTPLVVSGPCVKLW